MQQFDQADALHAWAGKERDEARRIVLVPTMGALHEGHLSLVREAKQHGDRVVVSIFVNPAQFAPTEDLASYPRNFEHDRELLENLEIDALFCPDLASIYPAPFDTYIVPEKLAAVLCGASRPNHFRGVCTVVLLLFRISRCHAAVFGEKDFQQLQIIRRMAEDLWLDVEVIGAPIIREADGLAMSSRNAYLSEQERKQAIQLSRGLDAAALDFEKGERNAERLLAATHSKLTKAKSARIDYAELVDAETLQRIERVDRDALLALAVYLGETRLIDNRRFSP